jgi:hypothetical protein
MYYKITNKDCEVYKKLHALRTQEKKIEKENINAINEKTGLKWKCSFGRHGQQNFRRVTSYEGFEFTEPEKVDLKVWRHHKDQQGIFVPNVRTKLGREMQEFLWNGLNGSNYNRVIEILKLADLRRFQFPYVEITKDEIIIIALGDAHEPKDKNVIEITKREFESYSI